MAKRRLIAMLIISILAAISAGCGNGSNNAVNANRPSSANRANSAAKTNVEELGVLINIPYETDDIVWKEDETNKKLVAVFRLMPTDSARLVAEAEKSRPSQPATISTESWFPAELIAQSSMSGDDTLSGKSYAASSFLQEPYKNGSVTRIDNTDYFVLDVSAK
ncbi:MAG: hypothetical protein IPK01_14205 [Acidobacteria bacterium]|nr:hypothetical protein [Acidobacteriota bacterium]